MTRLLASLFLSSLVAVSQVGSGKLDSGMRSGAGFNDSSVDYIRMFQNMGSIPGMGSGMSIGMTDDLAVSPDGTAYVIRSISGGNLQSSNSWQYELTAISPENGSVKWKLAIPGGRVSKPVLASDGLIFLTVDNYQMSYANFASGGSRMTPDQAVSSDGKLLIIATTGSSATVLHTIQTASDVLSAPKIAADRPGSYLVYVFGYDMMSWTAMFSPGDTPFSPGEKTLYAYRADGTLKFSVKLSGGNGMMPH